jgi:hypothetical protein
MVSFTNDGESLKHHLIDFFRVMQHEMEGKEVSPESIARRYVENQISMENGMKEYYDYLALCRQKDERLLRAVKKVKGKTFYKYLIELLEDRVDYTTMEIVNAPTGEHQSTNDFGRTIKEYWVDQRSVGTEGDSFEGTICVQLKENKFLKANYSC